VTEPLAEASIPRGKLMVLAAGTAWSLTGLALRLIDEADGFQITFYRSIGLVPVVLAIVAITSRGRVGAAFRSAGWVAVLAGASMATSNISMVFAILNTTVANTLFTLGIAPLLTAVAGRLVLGERLDRSSLRWFVVAAVGVGIMTADAINDGRLFGNAMALLMVLGYAGFTLAVRHGRHTDMTPALVWAGSLAGVFALVAAEDLVVPVAEAAIAMAIGGALLGGGLALYVLGSVTVRASELVLLGLVELVLAPVWVWLFLGERSRWTTLAGGLLVIGAVAARARTSDR
jgi:drug/metabolite transporter (DMT)-like permease